MPTNNNCIRVTNCQAMPRLARSRSHEIGAFQYESIKFNLLFQSNGFTSARLGQQKQFINAPSHDFRSRTNATQRCVHARRIVDGNVVFAG